MARKKSEVSIPSYIELFIPCIKALIELGGSGTVEEINTKVYEIARFSDDIIQIPHEKEGTRTEIDYRLAWSRTYLKKYGLLENSSRGIWALSKSGIEVDNLDPLEIVRKVRGEAKLNQNNQTNFDDFKQNEIVKEITESIDEKNEIVKEITKSIDENEGWKQSLLNILYKIEPSAFERLSQRLLRESGFVQVEVTGKAGDGGIDGKGIVRVSGLLNFPVIFQCKRYKGSVTPSEVRDFRGAMQGRADKGIIITTGTFTKDAKKEATRDGAPSIDLIDGALLCDKLKELKLGVETKLTETVEIKNEWFTNL